MRLFMESLEGRTRSRDEVARDAWHFCGVAEWGLHRPVQHLGTCLHVHARVIHSAYNFHGVESITSIPTYMHVWSRIPPSPSIYFLREYGFNMSSKRTRPIEKFAAAVGKCSKEVRSVSTCFGSMHDANWRWLDSSLWKMHRGGLQ